MKYILLLISLFPLYVSANFFDERYRGWLWFNEYSNDDDIPSNISPSEAKQIIEFMNIELENRKNIMVVDPSPENVKEYLLLEEYMWHQAMKLDYSYRQAKFLYPDLFDKANSPTNIFAVKAGRKIKEKDMVTKIKKLAEKYELFFYVDNSYSYGKKLSSIVKIFAEKYGFKIEDISIEHGDTKRVKFIKNYIIRRAKKDMPIIFAIKKNSYDFFELIRGYTTISELEEYAEIAANNLGA